MKLLIDAGNTRIKWALVEGNDWRRSGMLPVGQAAELARQFGGLQGVREVWVSNVAGEEVARHICVACAPLLPRVIVARDAQCGVRSGYSSPLRLGSDRWAALIAAWHLVRGACLVVNSGTATTVDALSDKGEFLGGLILPGVELMRRSLHDATAQLQAGQGEYAPFPQNTADAIYSGALQASCGAIDRQQVLLGEACPEPVEAACPEPVEAACPGPGRRGDVPVVLSGGASEALREHLNAPSRIVDNLVLQGILLIAQEA